MELDREQLVSGLRTLVAFRTVVCRNPDEFRRANDWIRKLFGSDEECLDSSSLAAYYQLGPRDRADAPGVRT